MQRCLDLAPDDGATLYAAACVAALAASADDSNRNGDQAIAHLRAAFARGYGRPQFATDPDLAGIRSRPEFIAMLNAEIDRVSVKTLQR